MVANQNKEADAVQITKIEDHPEFREYNKYQLWIYKLKQDFTCQSQLIGYHFQSEWLSVLPDGTVEIPKGYAWNGCSPKISMFDLFVVGTPDGIVDIKTMKPKTYYASMVHDALYQYYKWHDINRERIDELFFRMMKKSGFKLASLYYQIVRSFGGSFAGEKHNYSIPFVFI